MQKIVFDHGPNTEEHMLIVIDKTTIEENSSQTLQTTFKRFKVAMTILAGFNGIFNVTNTK